ncbi:dienelactone hydrolase family protein, partial [Myxococcota bacterium]|nr:dienelactone hydrolase family protein [Myxococcota bacterium]
PIEDAFEPPPRDAFEPPIEDAFEPPPRDAAPPPVDVWTPPPRLDAAPPPAEGCLSGTWSVSALGQARSAVVRAPPGVGQGAPLIIALHGNGDTAENFCLTSEICAFGVAQGAVVVVPQGRMRDVLVEIAEETQTVRGVHWDAYNSTPQSNEDLALLDALIAEADARCQSGRITLWGHSQGGFCAYLLSRIRNDIIDGALICAAAESIGLQFAHERPTPYFFLIGEQDWSWSGGQVTATIQALERAGHPTALITLPGVGHGGYLRGYNDQIWAFLNARAP